MTLAKSQTLTSPGHPHGWGFSFPHQLRQLSDIRRSTPRLIARKQVRCCSTTRRYAGDVNLPDEAHAVFQLDVGTDYTIRADLDAVPNAGTVGDARRCINRHVLTDPTATCY